jgi:hypothetical protein
MPAAARKRLTACQGTDAGPRLGHPIACAGRSASPPGGREAHAGLGLATSSDYVSGAEVPAGTEVRYSQHGNDTAPRTTVASNGALGAEAVFSRVVGPDVDVFGADIASTFRFPSQPGRSLSRGTDTQSANFRSLREVR